MLKFCRHVALTSRKKGAKIQLRRCMSQILELLNVIITLFQGDELNTRAGATNVISDCSLINCASMLLEAVGI